MRAGIKVVGAKGFEPSTSWSRTRHLNPINALFGVAYGIRSVISPLSVVPNLCLELGSTPVVRGDSCAHLHHYFRVARDPEASLSIPLLSTDQRLHRTGLHSRVTSAYAWCVKGLGA